MDAWSTAPEHEPVRSKPVNPVNLVKPVESNSDKLTVMAQDLEVRTEVLRIK